MTDTIRIYFGDNFFLIFHPHCNRVIHTLLLYHIPPLRQHNQLPQHGDSLVYMLLFAGYRHGTVAVNDHYLKILLQLPYISILHSKYFLHILSRQFYFL